MDPLPVSDALAVPADIDAFRVPGPLLLGDFYREPEDVTRGIALIDLLSRDALCEKESQLCRKIRARTQEWCQESANYALLALHRAGLPLHVASSYLPGLLVPAEQSLNELKKMKKASMHPGLEEYPLPISDPLVQEWKDLAEESLLPGRHPWGSDDFDDYGDFFSPFGFGPSWAAWEMMPDLYGEPDDITRGISLPSLALTSSDYLRVPDRALRGIPPVAMQDFYREPDDAIRGIALATQEFSHDLTQDISAPPPTPVASSTDFYKEPGDVARAISVAPPPHPRPWDFFHDDLYFTCG